MLKGTFLRGITSPLISFTTQSVLSAVCEIAVMQSWSSFFDIKTFQVPNKPEENLLPNLYYWTNNYIFVGFCSALFLWFSISFSRRDIWALIPCMAAIVGAVLYKKYLLKKNILPWATAGVCLFALQFGRWRAFFGLFLTLVFIGAHAYLRNAKLAAKAKAAIHFG